MRFAECEDRDTTPLALVRIESPLDGELLAEPGAQYFLLVVSRSLNVWERDVVDRTKGLQLWPARDGGHPLIRMDGGYVSAVDLHAVALRAVGTIGSSGEIRRADLMERAGRMHQVAEEASKLI